LGFCYIDAEDNYHSVSYCFNCGLLGEFVNHGFGVGDNPGAIKKNAATAGKLEFACEDVAGCFALVRDDTALSAKQLIKQGAFAALGVPAIPTAGSRVLIRCVSPRKEVV